MTDRYADFDATRARRGTTTLRAFGEDHIIPGSTPFGFALLMQRLESGDSRRAFTMDLAVEILKAAVGEDVAAKFLDAGFEADDMPDLLKALMELWKTKGPDAEGEAGAPAMTGDSSST